jgi:flagellar protein FliS
MNSTSQGTYLAAQVMTASPQRLRLMLIEGAIRFGRQAAEAWANRRFEAAEEAIDRCRAIITELLASPQPERLPQVTRPVVDLYRFLYETLNAASLSHDAARLADVLRLLEIERDTWRQVCLDLAEATPRNPPISGPHQVHPPGTRPAEEISTSNGGFTAEA